ncbi:hypothetical protein CR969_00780 [Candidatus Saccharibacteria bacterium]|nr:MAG: hypothetical protein CR969_00780 [Candidatus Saccharibacteria bacterium]
MDPYPQEPNQENKWYEMADAMNKVADLAYNDEYCEFIRDNALVTKTSWQMNTDKPVCIDTTENELFSFLPNNNGRHLVIKDFKAQLVENGDKSEIDVTFLANDHSMRISGHDGELFLQYTDDNDIPSLTLDEQGLLQLIFGVAEYKLGQEHVAAEYNDGEADMTNLLFGLGSITGKSTRSILTGVCDDNATFVARLVEQETPDAYGIANYIQSAEIVGEDEYSMTNESMLQIVNSNNPEHLDDEYQPAELAASGLGFESVTSEIFLSELQRVALSGLKGFNYYSSQDSRYEARQYAAICQNFLKTLGQLTGVRP